MSVRRSLARAALLVGLSVVVLGVLVRSATAGETTTSPGSVHIVKMTLTNDAIVVAADKFSKGLKYPRYPRGGSIHYDVVNSGTRAYSVKIATHVSSVIPPGQSRQLIVSWPDRGQFLYETLYKGKPLGPKGHVTIF